MTKGFLLICAILLGSGYGGRLLTPQKPADPPQTVPPALPPVPPEEAAKVNPLKPTAGGLAKAKQTYGWDCAVCHGERGDGKGDLGAKYNLKDWTDAASLQGMTDGEMFYIIQNGRGQMPSEGARVKPDDVWNLVLLVRSYPKKTS